VLEGITDAVIILDHEGTVRCANRATKWLWERPREDLIGRPTWEVSAESSMPDLWREGLRTVCDRAPVSLEAYCPPCAMWVEVHVSPWSGGLALVFTDVTERKQAEQQPVGRDEIP